MNVDADEDEKEEEWHMNVDEDDIQESTDINMDYLLDQLRSSRSVVDSPRIPP
jgi:hypothetical protein